MNRQISRYKHDGGHVIKNLFIFMNIKPEYFLRFDKIPSYLDEKHENNESRVGDFIFLKIQVFS